MSKSSWIWRPGPVRMGPVRFNISRNGLQSISVKAGRVSTILWSKNGRRGISSIDGPGSLNFQKSMRGKKRSTSNTTRNEEGSTVGAFGIVGVVIGFLFKGTLAVAGLVTVLLGLIMSGVIGG